MKYVTPINRRNNITIIDDNNEQNDNCLYSLFNSIMSCFYIQKRNYNREPDVMTPVPYKTI